MRTWIILALLLLAVVAWLSFPSREDQVARDLARSKNSRRDAQQVASTDIETYMVKLSESLIAEYDPDQEAWVTTSPSSSQLVTPYRPDVGPYPAPEVEAVRDENPGFVGAAKCAECHIEQFGGFIETAHHKTSSIDLAQASQGPIGEASKVKTRSPDVFYQVTKDAEDYFQSISFHGMKHQVPMQIVTGSAKSGQSYLYWHGDQLFQTHISYMSAHNEWIPSPGYSANNIDATRVIRPACLECHATFIHSTKPPNHYDRESAIWGISCERCHGPGKKHIEFHQQNPKAEKSQFVTLPSQLSRQRQLDICGQCHSGSFSLLKPAFSFRPGDDIHEFHELFSKSDAVGSIHTSNQLVRLKKSSCFQQSEMTCTTCHDPHQNQRGQTALFSKSCLECHQAQHCGMNETIGESISQDCVSCHMPLTEDASNPLITSRGDFFPSMVDHYIRVDREQTAKVLVER